MVVAFRQRVRDKKMLEKLATHDIQDVSVLFSLVDKCAKAAEGRAWHSPVTQAVKGESKPNVGTQAQGGDNGNNNNNKKKKAGGNQPLARAPTAAAIAVSGGHGGQEATNAPISCLIAMTVAQGARCTTPHAIASRSVGRSRSSRSNSARRCSSRAKMVHLPAYARANRKWTHRRRKT
jgi:hypothetical protein